MATQWRFTGNIDFFIRPARDSAERVLNALRQFGFGELDVHIEGLIRPHSVVQLGRPPNRIDLLTSISGIAVEHAWENRVEAELDTIPVSFIGLKELLDHKRTVARAQSLADLEKLEAGNRAD